MPLNPCLPSPTIIVNPTQIPQRLSTSSVPFHPQPHSHSFFAALHSIFVHRSLNLYQLDRIAIDRHTPDTADNAPSSLHATTDRCTALRNSWWSLTEEHTHIHYAYHTTASFRCRRLPSAAPPHSCALRTVTAPPRHLSHLHAAAPTRQGMCTRIAITLCMAHDAFATALSLFLCVTLCHTRT